MQVKDMFKKIAGFFKKKYFAYPLFWGYNLIYLGFILLSSPLFLLLLRESFVPLNVALMTYALILTPVASAIVGALPAFRFNKDKLLKLLFGVELPIVTLAFIRLLFIREMTPIMWMLFISAFVSIAGLLIILFDIKPKSDSKLSALFLSQEVSLILAGYLGILAAFFMPIIFVSFVKELISINYFELIKDIIFDSISSNGLYIIYSLLFFVFIILLFVFTVGLFLITPIAALFIYWKSFKEKLEDIKDRYNSQKAAILGFSFAFTFLFIAIGLSIQPHSSRYIPQLNKIDPYTSFEERQPDIKELLKDENKLKSTLINNYLARYRYLGDEKINFIEEGYKQVLNCPDSIAKNVQNAFNNIALPFVFQGDFSKVSDNANKHYEEIFDAPIQDGERSVISKALKATNTKDEIKAGLLDKDKKTVRVVSRKVNVITDKNTLLAKVSVEEEYENTANEIQEVYYEFALPQDAVITGMKLGPKLEYTATISPKGAARRTYEKQVRIQRDPALLEQTGPRQYRLRVFPIPQKRIRSFNPHIPDTINPNQKIKYEYIAFRNAEGISLPQITQTRNAFLNKKTIFSYIVDGKKLSTPQNKSVSEIPIKKTDLNLTQPQGFKIGSKYMYFIPHKYKENSVNNVKGLKIALLLDASYSSKDINLLNYLKNNLPLDKFTQNNLIDAYFFNSEVSKKISLSPNNLNTISLPVNYGKTRRLNALQSINKDYDLVLMFTDGSSFDEYIGKKNAPKLPFPVYLIHTDKIIPQYNDELTLELIKDRGNVFTDTEEALKYYLLSKPISSDRIKNTELIDIDNDGTWLISANPLPYANTVTIKSNTDNVKNNLLFIKMMDKFIKKTIRIKNTNDIKTLEDIHSYAKNFSIVTPYSSLIALVDEQQKNELNEAESKNDKFSTKFDVGKEEVENPSGEGVLNVSSVPEPEEWLLIISIIILLILFTNKKRIQCLLIK